MTDGTSQGLFVVVAIVIFGIFVALSYSVFGSDGLTGDLDNLFSQSMVRVQDRLDGVSERVLFDLNTAVIDFPTAGFDLDRDFNNQTLTLTSTGGGGGIEIPTADLLNEHTDYILTFDMELLDGVVTHIGGHLSFTNDVKVYINGEQVFYDDSNGAVANPLNDWAAGVRRDMEVGETVQVRVEFNTGVLDHQTYDHRPIKIQPNRFWYAEVGVGYGNPYTVEFSNMAFLEMN